MTTTDISKSLPLPPGDFGLPLIGETIDFLREPDFADKRYQKYGSIFKTNLFGKPTVMAIGAEANRFILTHENQYFSITWPHSTKVLLGSESLALQVGTQHLQNPPPPHGITKKLSAKPAPRFSAVETASTQTKPACAGC